ncbi:MAG: hypothetical protein PHQ66_03545 [Candidatus Nanoarchaeia archaeon]|nr:hypothetical protein [Candidatus Nanoarchaeia archaeon]MDD5357563.1 hypothetical protein [Candidatus Nanoarchaeia archaeon]MDD5588482.1 hypothetical protein [Candidatus Nanoarchaeia archaeon]
MKKEDKKYYLKCNVYDGMFSNEKLIQFDEINGKGICGFWPDDCIKNGLLEVRVVEHGKDKSLIRGPFTASSGYGFFQGNGFYVSNDLLSCE